MTVLRKGMDISGHLAKPGLINTPSVIISADIRLEILPGLKKARNKCSHDICSRYFRLS